MTDDWEELNDVPEGHISTENGYTRIEVPCYFFWLVSYLCPESKARKYLAFPDREGPFLFISGTTTNWREAYHFQQFSRARKRAEELAKTHPDVHVTRFLVSRHDNG